MAQHTAFLVSKIKPGNDEPIAVCSNLKAVSTLINYTLSVLVDLNELTEKTINTSFQAGVYKITKIPVLQ